MFFIKELWQPEFFREILGLHVGIHFLDSELGPKRYLFGRWKREGKKDKPILITTYVKGNPLKKHEVDDYLHALGRQYAFHQVLSLYDVDHRHFIVQKGIVARIDFGMAFSNTHMAYQGFWDFHYNKLVHSRAFHEGIAEEHNRIENMLSATRARSTVPRSLA